MRCVAHTLQLAVFDTLKDSNITNILTKVRALVRKLRNQTYIYILKKEGLKMPILDCNTRWHSTFDMLDRTISLKRFIQNMSGNDLKLKKYSLSNFEWKQIEAISEVLLPAKMCTKKLQSEQLTLSDFYGAWIICKIQIQKMTNSYAKKFISSMSIREMHIMNNNAFISAIFMDPRYKITLTEEQSMAAINHLISIWIHMKMLEKEHEELTMDDKNADNLSESEKSCNSKSGDEIEEFLKSNFSNESSDQNDLSNSQKSTISTRIETLLKSYHIDQKRIGNKTNILKFWKSMESIHPELHELAKVVFSVPGTQVSVERLFSGLKFILSPYRTNISSSNLEDQLLVRTNRLFEKKETVKYEYIKIFNTQYTQINIYIIYFCRFMSGNPITEQIVNQNHDNSSPAMKRKKKQMLLTNMIT